MDVSQALSEVENSLRDFIADVLEKRHGLDWIQNCGVSAERIKRWEQRKTVEATRQRTGAVEERLLYYADFYDLSTILQKNWSGEFPDAFGKWKTMEVFLDELEKLRDPNAHNRELLPHQKHLLLGIAGEIRNRLIRYRSKLETSEDYYPRIECVRDSLGNVWIPSKFSRGEPVFTGRRLRIGDTVEFVVSATDPLGETLSYRIKKAGLRRDTPYDNWQEDNVLRVSITPEDVSRNLEIDISIRSPRPYHATNDYDDDVEFWYEVLPPDIK